MAYTTRNFWQLGKRQIPVDYKQFPFKEVAFFDDAGVELPNIKFARWLSEHGSTIGIRDLRTKVIEIFGHTESAAQSYVGAMHTNGKISPVLEDEQMGYSKFLRATDDGSKVFQKFVELMRRSYLRYLLLTGVSHSELPEADQSIYTQSVIPQLFRDDIVDDGISRSRKLSEFDDYRRQLIAAVLNSFVVSHQSRYSQVVEG